MNLSMWCNRIIRWGFYLLFILVPLILTPWNYELFEYNKIMVTYALTVIIVGAWLIKSFHERELRIAKTILDVPIFLFVGSQLISSLFSMDTHVSWFGYYSRFNGGMWSIISYALLYVAFVSNMLPVPPAAAKESIQKKASKKMNIPPPPIASNPIPMYFRVTLMSAAIVALYGVAEHFGIDKHLWVQDVQNRVFSTLGQPNWLAAYLVALIPLGLAFALPSPSVKKIDLEAFFSSPARMLYTGVTLLFFITLLFTRSRSGLLALAIADGIFWIFLVLRTSYGKNIRVPVIVLHFLFALIVFVNGSNIAGLDSFVSLAGIQNLLTHHTSAPSAPSTPAGTPALETGGTESGVIRKYVWQGAINAWKSSTQAMLIGTGTETFAFAFYRYRPVGHNLTSEWDFLYNKAHNEYLNYLATTGTLGLGSYLLVLGTFAFWFIKQYRGSSLSHTVISQSGGHAEDVKPLGIYEIALFAGWISILVTNFFGFSVVIMQLFLFLFPAMILVAEKFDTYDTHFTRIKLKATWPVGWMNVGVAIIGAALVVILALFWQADLLFATGYRLSHSGQFAQAQPYIEQAISLNSSEPLYHDELSSTLASLAVGAFEQQNATVGAQLARQSLSESDRALIISPRNVNYWKTRTKIYYSFSNYDPKLNDAAVQALEHARELSPNDPKIYYNLAILYGRIGKNDKALEDMNESKTLKPDYHDAYYGLYVFYNELKKPDLARAVLEEYIQKIDPSDKDFNEILNKK